ncbi:MAG: response regulator [Anaerolineae bacterium]|nr:response regulator [Anaerolineae bacterium]
MATTADRLPALLRSALRHLYDPLVLGSNPLVSLLGLTGVPDPASALRQELTRAIRSLQPDADLPPDSKVWRLYEVLLYRYVQRQSQLEVADQLGLSIRHLGRLETQAIQVLAERLRPGLRPQSGDGSDSTAADEAGSSFAEELAWLSQSTPAETADPAAILRAVVDLVQPVAARHDVTLELAPCPPLMPLAVHPVALRQILLSLFGAAIRGAPGRRVSIAITARPFEVEVRVRAGRPAQPVAEKSIAESLDMARRLAATFGGALAIEATSETQEAILTLPASGQVPVLAIDDNENTLQLFQRYATNTRYRLLPATSLAGALEVAREASPRIIVLDVMMPDIDGWEALGRLRQHPLTGHVPIVVCTILAEEELALSLGAAGFVRKPVSREAFLSALDQACPVAPAAR